MRRWSLCGRERCITARSDESTPDSRHKKNWRPLNKQVRVKGFWDMQWLGLIWEGPGALILATSYLKTKSKRVSYHNTLKTNSEGHSLVVKRTCLELMKLRTYMQTAAIRFTLGDVCRAEMSFRRMKSVCDSDEKKIEGCKVGVVCLTDGEVLRFGRMESVRCLY